jgi:hypothetical protein
MDGDQDSQDCRLRSEVEGLGSTKGRLGKRKHENIC